MAATISPISIAAPAELVTARPASSANAAARKKSSFKSELTEASQREPAPSKKLETSNKQQANHSKANDSNVADRSSGSSNSERTNKSGASVSASDTNKVHAQQRQDSKQAVADAEKTSPQNQSIPVAGSKETSPSTEGKSLPADGEVLPQSAQENPKVVVQSSDVDVALDEVTLDADISKLQQQIQSNPAIAAGQPVAGLGNADNLLVNQQAQGGQSNQAPNAELLPKVDEVVKPVVEAQKLLDGESKLRATALGEGDNQVPKAGIAKLDSLTTAAASNELTASTTNTSSTANSAGESSRVNVSSQIDGKAADAVSQVSANQQVIEKEHQAIAPVASKDSAQTTVNSGVAVTVQPGESNPLSPADTSNLVGKAADKFSSPTISSVPAKENTSAQIIETPVNTKADETKRIVSSDEIKRPNNLNEVKLPSGVGSEEKPSVAQDAKALASQLIAKGEETVNTKDQSSLESVNDSKVTAQSAINSSEKVEPVAPNIVKNDLEPKISQLQAIAASVDAKNAQPSTNISSSSNAQTVTQNNSVPTSVESSNIPQATPSVPSNVVSNSNVANDQSISLNQTLEKLRAGVDTTDSKATQEASDSKAATVKTVSNTEGLQQLTSLQNSLRNTNPVQMQMPPGTPPSAKNWGRAVADKVFIAASQNLRVANIQLDPPELGALQIRLQVTGPDQQMSVAFSSPHASVRDVLEQQIPRLKEMLAEQGINLGESSVNDQNADNKQEMANRERKDGQGYAGGVDMEDPINPLNTQGTLSLVDFYA